MSNTKESSAVKLYKVSIVAASILAVLAAVLFVVGTYNIASGLLALALAILPALLHFQHVANSRALRVVVRQEISNLPVPQINIEGTVPTEQSVKELTLTAQQLNIAEQKLSKAADLLATDTIGSAQKIEREGRALRETARVLAEQQSAIIQELEHSKAMRKSR